LHLQVSQVSQVISNIKLILSINNINYNFEYDIDCTLKLKDNNACIKNVNKKLVQSNQEYLSNKNSRDFQS